MTIKKAIFALVMASTSLSPIFANGNNNPAQQLIERMAKIQKQGVMYGHQDDPFYGLTWEWEQGRSDTRELVGDYPGVMGFDLGGIEVGDRCDLDSVPFDWMRREMQAQHKRGGIITISWHPRNPLLGTTAWIQNDTMAYNTAVESLVKIHQNALADEVIDPKTTVKSILPGGEKHEKFMLWLHRVADFLCSIKDEKGNNIPFIFRPWHENNGSWFWWGQNNCTDEEWHALWNMTQDFIRERLPENIVWSYSPNLQGNWTEQQWLVRYPGDDRVDLIGVDAYQWGTEADFRTQLTADLEIATKIAHDHGKLLAMTECGYQNSPDATWWTRVFRPVISKYPVCYFLPWRNWKKEHFGVAKETATADDFKKWASEKDLLFVNDIKKIK